METTSTSQVTMTDADIFRMFEQQGIKEYLIEQLQNAPKIFMGGHQLIFDIQDIQDVDEFYLQKAKEDLRETPETIAQGIKELKELIAGDPDLSVLDIDDFYTIFLRPCKWYASSAYSLIKRFFRFRENYAHLNIRPSKEKAALCSGLIYPLPLRGTDGCRIFVIEIGKRWKPKNLSLEQIFKGLLLSTYAAMLEPKTQIAGGRVIIDLEGLTLSQVTYFSPSFAKMVVDFVQKVLPIRLKSIHIVNQSFLFNMVFALFKPLLEEKIRQRIHFHGTDRESLMTFIDKSMLLKKHGGELEITEGSIGMDLWRLFCLFDPLFFWSIQDTQIKNDCCSTAIIIALPSLTILVMLIITTVVRTKQ